MNAVWWITRILHRRWRAACLAPICAVLVSLLVSTNGMAQNSQSEPPGNVPSQSAAPSNAAPASDAQIASEINHKLMESPALRALGLSVWVRDGVATLTGSVPSEDVRHEVNALAHSTPGVKVVDDQLTISDLPAADTAPKYHGSVPPPPPPGAGPSEEPPPPPAMGNSPQSGFHGEGTEPSQHAPLPMVTIPAATPVTVMMLNPVDTKHDHPGFQFRGVVMRDVILLSGATAIPRGAYVDGTVIDARPSGRLKGRPKLALALSRVEIGNESVSLTTQPWMRSGPGKGGQTVSTTGTSAAVGAMAGGIVGGGATAALGAALGGLGGLGISALSHGARIVVPAESVLTFYLDAPVTLRAAGPNVIRSLAGNVPASQYGGENGPYPPPPNGPGPYPGPYGQGEPPPPPPPVPGAPPGGYPY